jgi:hypothetical protein
LFDNLKGKGKPLTLANNPFAGDASLAHAILKDNDAAPTWIMDRNLILSEREELRQQIKRKWAWHLAYFEGAAAPEKDRLTLSWDDFCLQWQAQIVALNKRIVTYNLKRPSANMEIFKLILEEELERAHAKRWLK